MFVRVVGDVFGHAAITVTDASAIRSIHNWADKCKEFVFYCLQLYYFLFGTAACRSRFLLNFVLLVHRCVYPFKKFESYYCLSKEVSIELSELFFPFATFTLLLLQMPHEKHLVDEARVPLTIALQVFAFSYLVVLWSDQKSIVFICWFKLVLSRYPAMH